MSLRVARCEPQRALYGLVSGTGSTKAELQFRQPRPCEAKFGGTLNRGLSRAQCGVQSIGGLVPIREREQFAGGQICARGSGCVLRNVRKGDSPRISADCGNHRSKSASEGCVGGDASQLCLCLIDCADGKKEAGQIDSPGCTSGIGGRRVTGISLECGLQIAVSIRLK